MPLRWILVPVLAVVVVVTTFVGLALYFRSSSPAPYYGPPYYWWGFGWPFFGFGWFFFPVFFILIFLGFRWFFWGDWGHNRRYYDPALQTLRERYARGEITKEQFNDMTRNLLADQGGER